MCTYILNVFTHKHTRGYAPTRFMRAMKYTLNLNDECVRVCVCVWRLVCIAQRGAFSRVHHTENFATAFVHL